MKGGIRENLGSEKWAALWGKRKYQNLPANKNLPALGQEQMPIKETFNFRTSVARECLIYAARLPVQIPSRK